MKIPRTLNEEVIKLAGYWNAAWKKFENGASECLGCPDSPMISLQSGAVPFPPSVSVRPTSDATAVSRIVGAEALAHLTEDGRAHELEHHLVSVGELAEGFADPFGSSSVARIAGRWHDLGKYSGNFQRMIREENGFEAHIEIEEQAPRDHSTAGAVHAIRHAGLDKDVAAVIAFGAQACPGKASIGYGTRSVLTPRSSV